MNNFDEILNNEWNNLISATKTAKHPFHQFVLSNSTNNHPDSRLVILRHVAKQNRTIGFNEY